MGVIKVETSGSFPYRNGTFPANDHGHAHAVIDALRFLANEVLPAAVEQDLRLLEQGSKPAKGYFKPQGETK